MSVWVFKRENGESFNLFDGVCLSAGEVRIVRDVVVDLHSEHLPRVSVVSG